MDKRIGSGHQGLDRLFVETSRAKRAFSRMDVLMERGRESNFCRALLLLGPSRCGKTTIVREWCRRRKQADGSFRHTITEVPVGCTLKGMAAQLLQDLGDPDPDFGSQNEKTRRIIEVAEGHDLIVIDEVQRLIDANTDKVKKEVTGWLTNLLNHRVCPLLLVGERSAELVFEGSLYLTGRTLGQVDVDPYDWHDPVDQLEFRMFLNSVSKELGLDEPSDLAEEGTALRLHSYSAGHVGQVITLVEEARGSVRRARRPRITAEDLAEAVDLLRVGQARRQVNPFRIENPRPGGEPRTVRDVEPRRRRRA